MAHKSTLLQILELWSEEKPEKAVKVREVPRYAEVIEKGVGYFLHNPAQADPKKIYYE